MTGSSTDHVASLPLGKVLRGEFRIEAHVGSGGMSRVYRAHQLTVDRSVIVKVMTPPRQRADEWRARFLQEARVASKVRHPGIVTIYSFGEEPGVGPYIAMEFVDGESLRAVLQREGHVEPGRACSLMAQVCRAMHAAHAEGIVHRDLKPDNIMVERRDEREVARVLDFGVAKPSDSVVNTLDEHVVGTPDYMAPEQARKNPVDARTDVYAAGIILFELLVGERPYRAPDALTLMFKHVSQPLPVERMASELHDTFGPILAAACAKDPAQRYADAREMARALEQVLRESGWAETGGAAEPSESAEELSVPRGAAPVGPPPVTPAPAPGFAVVEPRPRGQTIAFVLLTVAVGVGVAWVVSRDEVVPVESRVPSPLRASTHAADVGQVEDAPLQQPAGAQIVAARQSVSSARSRAVGAADAVAERASQVDTQSLTPRRPRVDDDDDFHRVAPPAVNRPEVLSPFED